MMDKINTLCDDENSPTPHIISNDDDTKTYSFPSGLSRFVSFSSRDCLIVKEATPICNDNNDYGGASKNLHENIMENAKTTKIYSFGYLINSVFFFFIILQFGSTLHGRMESSSHNDIFDIKDEHSIYIPGGGFAGFWYTLGRIQSIPNPEDYTYYCYSAGCLVSVAHLENWSLNETVSFALGARNKWKQGIIGRFDVVDDFVTNLLRLPSIDDVDHVCSSIKPKEDSVENFKSFSQPKKISEKIYDSDHQKHSSCHFSLENPSWLTQLKIITSSKDDKGIVVSKIQTPSNMYELREMLIQTTWIPYVTGRSYWYQNKRNDELHMDGGATRFEHPTMKLSLNLPPRTDILMNTLNMDLSVDMVHFFWKMGHEKGVKS